MLRQSCIPTSGMHLVWVLNFVRWLFCTIEMATAFEFYFFIMGTIIILIDLQQEWSCELGMNPTGCGICILFYVLLGFDLPLCYTFTLCSSQISSAVFFFSGIFVWFLVSGWGWLIECQESVPPLQSLERAEKGLDRSFVRLAECL